MGIDEAKRRKMEELARRRRAERKQEQNEDSTFSVGASMRKKLDEFNEKGIAEVQQKKAEGTYVPNTLGEMRNDPRYADKIRTSKGFATMESAQHGIANGVTFGAMGKLQEKYGNQDLNEAYAENKNKKVEFAGEMAGAAITMGVAAKPVAGKLAGKIATTEGASGAAKFVEGKLVKKAAESSIQTVAKRTARVSAMNVLAGRTYRSDAKVVVNQEYVNECRAMPLAALQQEMSQLSMFIQERTANVQAMASEKGLYTNPFVSSPALGR